MLHRVGQQGVYAIIIYNVFATPSAIFEPAFALGMEGLIPEAIREMESLRSKHDVELGVAMALLHFHGEAKMVDRYALSRYRH